MVGIGASAGGLEAFTQLISNLPNDTGMAFVLLQHLEPSQPSMLSDIIARSTPMPVQEVEDGMAVAPNQGLCDTAQPGPDPGGRAVPSAVTRSHLGQPPG